MTDDRDLALRVRRIVASMEPLTREVFLLTSLAERGYPETALWLSIEVAEVEQRLAAAILEICRGLRDDAGAGS